jgi:hypothetical protein
MYLKITFSLVFSDCEHCLLALLGRVAFWKYQIVKVYVICYCEGTRNLRLIIQRLSENSKTGITKGNQQINTDDIERI